MPFRILKTSLDILKGFERSDCRTMDCVEVICINKVLLFSLSSVAKGSRFLTIHLFANVFWSNGNVIKTHLSDPFLNAFQCGYSLRGCSTDATLHLRLLVLLGVLTVLKIPLGFSTQFRELLQLLSV
ncbi:hypothetical protein TNIN_275931 [Trichonephila inaurata madagascariensis]|uniref:Uncharacterized protein n=1 Tax=Trichonephila inaurata madagascariensis TaxID=2747483 RepID=A0A8X6XWX0_9ARAC|nr:hypothetical protein TNIN_275931 [Trichonephila inaurata madagascariensis]